MLAVSMRMQCHNYPTGQEMRDALTHDWWHFLGQVLPHTAVLPVPNMGGRAVLQLQELPVSGLILTGGDDWGVFPQRDQTERELLLWAMRMSLPVLGVCRGAQVINKILGGRQHTGAGPQHAGTRHGLNLHAAPFGLDMPTLEVNSYHANGLYAAELAEPLAAWATAADGTVEAFSTRTGNITGIMWHPEREAQPQSHDICLFRHLFQGEVA